MPSLDSLVGWLSKQHFGLVPKRITERVKRGNKSYDRTRTVWVKPAEIHPERKDYNAPGVSLEQGKKLMVKRSEDGSTFNVVNKKTGKVVSTHNSLLDAVHSWQLGEGATDVAKLTLKRGEALHLANSKLKNGRVIPSMPWFGSAGREIEIPRTSFSTDLDDATEAISMKTGDKAHVYSNAKPIVALRSSEKFMFDVNKTKEVTTFDPVEVELKGIITIDTHNQIKWLKI